jgi:hypothetical protein
MSKEVMRDFETALSVFAGAVGGVAAIGAFAGNAPVAIGAGVISVAMLAGQVGGFIGLGLVDLAIEIGSPPEDAGGS